jgi:hypothetical protein
MASQRELQQIQNSGKATVTDDLKTRCYVCRRAGLYLFCRGMNGYSLAIANKREPIMSSRNHEQQQIAGNQEGLIWVRKGSLLLVRSGSMLVARTADVERLFAEGILLHEGDCYTAERSGWLCLRGGANSSNLSTFLCIEPIPRSNFLRRLIGRFRSKPAACPSPAVR